MKKEAIVSKRWRKNIFSTNKIFVINKKLAKKVFIIFPSTEERDSWQKWHVCSCMCIFKKKLRIYPLGILIFFIYDVIEKHVWRKKMNRERRKRNPETEILFRYEIADKIHNNDICKFYVSWTFPKTSKTFCFVLFLNSNDTRKWNEKYCKKCFAKKLNWNKEISREKWILLSNIIKQIPGKQEKTRIKSLH